MPSFQPLQPPLALHDTLFSPVFSACYNGQIHLFGAGETPNTGRRLVLDGEGQPAGIPFILPDMLIEGVAAGSEGLLILNGQVAANRCTAHYFTLAGHQEWDCLVPVSRSSARFIQPAFLEGSAVAVWAMVGGTTSHTPGAVREASGPASLAVAVLSAGSSEPAHNFPLKGSVTALSLTSTPAGLLAACDPRGRLELIHLTAKQIIWHIQVEGVQTPISPSVAICNEQICLAWITGETLFIQWFDLTGQAISAPQQLAAAPQRARLLSTCLIPNNNGALAIAYIQETTTDEWNMLEGEFGRRHRFLPKLNYEEFICALQPGTTSSGPWLTITPPGLPYHTGCWLQDTLYLLHGEQVPVFSHLKLES